MAPQKKTKEIIHVIRTLKRFVRRFEEPAVTEVSRRETPFHVLIACLLSLRTRDATTRAAAQKLFAVAETPRSILALPAKRIEKLIYPVGFYRTKAKRIKEISRLLIEKHGSRVPSRMDELLALPGVGRKTANIVMVFAHGKPGLPIDTHCHRIPNRLGWISTKTPEKTEAALREIIPRRYWSDFNDIFVTFGQNHCTPLRPKCGTCPVAKHCMYYKEIYLQGKRA